MMLARSISPQSHKIVLLFTIIGKIIEVRPKTKAILAIFEPITLPKAISGRPLKAACKETNNSGAEVPKETTNKPITIFEILKWLAIFEADLTK